MIKQIYLAGPFFNTIQLDQIKRIEKLCEMLQIKYFSPRKDNLFSPGESKEKAKEVFENNLKAMNESDLILVLIEGSDPGTMYEFGYCYHAGKDILVYSDNKNRKLNLMLSFSCIGFSNDERDLLDILVRLNSGEYVKKEFEGDNI